jgi:putative peptide zinc metalloprotease protein
VTTAGDLVTAANRLVVARDGAECVLGRPDLGIYVDVPEPGAVFVEALKAGASVDEATRQASQTAGEPVDGADFLAGLAEAGLLDPPGAQGPADGPSAPARARPIRWIEGVSPEVARWLFGRVAWAVYVASAVVALAILVGQRQLRPTFESFYFIGDPVLSILLYAPIALLLRAVHEVWHWLAGRAVGVPAVFRISYRGLFVVFETDLTQIVTIPRRQRYGAFFAGLAFDCVVLATALLLRLANYAGVVALNPTFDRLLGALVLGQIIVIVWQWAALFLRSDVYAVVANALRCQNLYRTTWLTVKDRLWRLTSTETEELEQASPRDRSVAGWFGLVYLVGLIAMAWVFLTVIAPALTSIGIWLAANLVGHRLDTAAFWEALAVSLYLVAYYGAPVLLAVRERRLRARGALQ